MSNSEIGRILRRLIAAVIIFPPMLAATRSLPSPEIVIQAVTEVLAPAPLIETEDGSHWSDFKCSAD